MKQVTTALQAHFNGSLTTLATCWKVTRRDGVVLGFTDHDASKRIDGVLYLASSGYFRTAIANSATTSVDNLEIRGFLDNALISEMDLRNGAYDFAEVEIFAINWMDLSQGICRLRYGFFGEVTIRPSGLFVVELRGLMQLFSQTVGETIGPDCRADLGDERCKVVLLPEVRRSGSTYKAGDRVVITGDAKNAAIAIPIQNQNFDWYANDKYFVWEAFSGLFTNYPDAPKTGLYYVRPTKETGSFRRRHDISPELGIEHTFGLSFHAKAKEDGWQVGAIVEVINISGIGGVGDQTNYHVKYTFEIPYANVVADGTWNRFESSWSQLLLQSDNINAVRITMRWRRSPNPLYDNLAGTVPKMQLDDARLSLDDVPLIDAYSHMDLPNPSSVSSVIGWGGLNNVTYPGNVNLQPGVGNAYLTNSTWTSAPAQTVALAGSGADLIELDAGNYRLKVLTKVGGLDWGYTARITVECRSAINSLLGTLTTGLLDVKPAGEWLNFELSGIVPPLTRSLVFSLGAGLAKERVEVNDNSRPQIGVDSIVAALVHEDTNSLNIMQYGGVEYQAIVGGVTGTVSPTVTQALGEIVEDGAVTWKASKPVNTFLGTAGVVYSNTEFTLPDVDAVDDWFTWGVLYFLDGPNRTRGVEVLKWNNTTKRITIMLPALVAITPGTKVRVHSGCDKTRGAGGCFRYKNILNFRGEPEVPGTDQYFAVGGSGTSNTKSKSRKPS